jgi:hypothetical protein
MHTSFRALHLSQLKYHIHVTFNSRESHWKILTRQMRVCDCFQRRVCGGGELQRLYSWLQRDIGV